MTRFFGSLHTMLKTYGNPGADILVVPDAILGRIVADPQRSGYPNL